jgi:hypothetical protein
MHPRIRIRYRGAESVMLYQPQAKQENHLKETKKQTLDIYTIL